MDIAFHLPGTTEPAITVRRSGLGRISVLVDGVPAKQRKLRTLTWDIPLPDGSVKELRLKGQWTGLKAVVDGLETPLEPPLSGLTRILTLLPVALVVIGGLLGALVGVGGAAINARIARTSMRSPMKVGAMLGVTALAVAVYLGIAFAIAPIPQVETGTCLNGVREGGEVTVATTRAINCASPHDNEVVGTIDYPGDGALPDDATLQAFAEARCIEAFATYVGIDFQSSTLNMIPIAPSSETWARGDRQIGCVVVAGDGGKMTGSVKGTAR